MPDPEERRSEPEEQIRDILSDLDRILEDLGPAPPAPPPATRGAEEPPRPQPSPAQEPAKPGGEGLKIELAPRAGTIRPSEKPAQSEPSEAKPLASQAKSPLEIKFGSEPAPAPPGAAAAQPPQAPTPAAAGAEAHDDIPAGAGKDQIRRVAVLWSPGAEKAREAFVKFLDESARTISKKPLYLRKVLVEPVASDADDEALVEKARLARAAAVLGLLEGVPEARLRELGAKFSRAGIAFRAVAAADLDKRATAVDIVVDLMLLGPES